MKHYLNKLFLAFFALTIIFFISTSNVNAQACGHGTLSMVQGCNQDRTTGTCVADITTTTYNCSWNGSSCIGLESTTYCDSSCNRIPGDLVEIPCGGGGGGGGGGTANNCPVGQVPNYYNPPQYTCQYQCTLPNREAGSSCGGGKVQCEVGYCAVPATPAPSAPSGYHNSSSCTSTLGWACDPDDYNQAIWVHFYDGDPYSGSATFLGGVVADQSYDANVATVCGGNAAHSFTFNTPSNLIDGASHTIYAFAINIMNGSTNPLLTSSPKSIICPTPTPVPPSPSPSPIPACAVTTSPTSISLVSGGSTTVTASVTSGLGSATVTRMDFGSYNTAIATVNPASDSSSPYSTTVTSVTAGSTAVWATATLSDGRSCPSSGSTDSDITITNPTPSPSPTPIPACEVTTSPATLSLAQGSTGTVTASVTSGLGTSTITRMRFGSYDTSVATVNPTSDTTSVYSTIVTALTQGSTAIWATADLSDGRTCPASGILDTNLSVTPAACLVTAPTITSITRNSATSATIGWTPGNVDTGSIQKLFVSQSLNQVNNDCTLGTSPGCVVNQTALPASQSSYSTGNVLAAGSVYYVRIVNYVDSTCNADSNSTNPPEYGGDPLPYLSSCSISPSSVTLQIGDSAILTSTVNSNAIIGRVDFTSSDPSAISATSPDITSPYTTTIQANAPGNASITSTVNFTVGVVACTNNVGGNTTLGGGPGNGGSGGGSNGDTSVTINNLADSWWQTVDSDLTSNGSLNSTVPTGLYFGLPGSGGYAGIPTYTTTTNITSANSSANNWITQNTNNTYPVFDYNYFENQIPSDVTFNTISSPSISGNTFASGGTASYGYYWYKYDGSASGLDLTINSAVNIGNRKVILLVKSANLNINSTVNLNDGLGFFMSVVDKNINIDSSVGGGSGPNLEGFYIADNKFNTGLGTNQLKVRGAVVAYDGVTLSRDLGSGNLSTAGEQFEYAPDQSLLFPSKLAVRKISWKEIAP